MRTFYHCRIGDRTAAKERRFVREVGSWPFSSLPAPGDAVIIDVPGTGGLRSQQEAGLTTWTSERADVMEARLVDRVVFSPATEEAFIELRSDGLRNDISQQVDVLLQAGFRETSV
jgi:hypothetical protein